MAIDKLSANAFATGAVANSLGYTPANLTGDNFTGNVGINNSSPAVLANTLQLAIKANVNGDSMFVAQNSNGLTTAKFGFQYTGSVDNPVIGSYTTHPFLFLTNNAERMRISANGNIGIGISTNTTRKLHVDGINTMGTGSGAEDLLTLTNNNCVNNGVAEDRIGLTISAHSDVSDRRIGIYNRAGNINFNNPDISFWQSGQGIAYRETMRVRADTATLQFNSGYGSVASAYGCRVWVNFNGSGTSGANQTIRGSGGITSVYKNGAGDYTINFSITFPDTNYSWTSGSSYNNNSAGWWLTNGTTATTSIRMYGRVNNATNNNYDGPECTLAIFR